MRKQTIFILVILILLAIAIRERVILRRYRAALVDSQMHSQMEAIQNRARHFLELKTGQSFLRGGTIFDSLSKYEVRIAVPTEHNTEFLEWMRDTSLLPAKINNWPSSSGASKSFSTNQLIYRVYYGKEPINWK